VGKRGNGEGSIYRRRNGTWAAQYTVWTAEGRRRRSVSGKTRAEVSRKLTRAMADRDGGLVCDAGKLTVGEHIGADDLNAEPGQIFRPVRCGVSCQCACGETTAGIVQDRANHAATLGAGGAYDRDDLISCHSKSLHAGRDSPSGNALETQIYPDRRVFFGSGVPVTVFGAYHREARKLLGRWRELRCARHRPSHLLKESSQLLGRDDEVDHRFT
jgi:hypothetical protein